MKTSKSIEAERREAKRIKDRNYRFKKMSPERQRVTIAKDVIALLLAEEITAKKGVYMELDNGIETKFWPDGGLSAPLDKTGKVQLHKLIESSETCDVCGIGACFVAAVRRADNLQVKDLRFSGDDGAMRRYLQQWFSLDQISLIEAAFEKKFVYYAGNNTQKGFRAEDFGKDYAEDGPRLQAIFQNIVDNDGEFIP